MQKRALLEHTTYVPSEQAWMYTGQAVASGAGQLPRHSMISIAREGDAAQPRGGCCKGLQARSQVAALQPSSLTPAEEGTPMSRQFLVVLV